MEERLRVCAGVRSEGGLLSLSALELAASEERLEELFGLLRRLRGLNSDLGQILQGVLSVNWAPLLFLSECYRRPAWMCCISDKRKNKGPKWGDI